MGRPFMCRFASDSNESKKRVCVCVCVCLCVRAGVQQGWQKGVLPFSARLHVFALFTRDVLHTGFPVRYGESSSWGPVQLSFRRYPFLRHRTPTAVDGNLCTVSDANA